MNYVIDKMCEACDHRVMVGGSKDSYGVPQEPDEATCPEDYGQCIRADERHDLDLIDDLAALLNKTLREYPYELWVVARNEVLTALDEMCYHYHAELDSSKFFAPAEMGVKNVPVRN